MADRTSTITYRGYFISLRNGKGTIYLRGTPVHHLEGTEDEAMNWIDRKKRKEAERDGQ